MSPADGVLIERVRATDDRQAFGELVERHQSAVRRFLRHATHGNYALADDLAQETFLKAYASLDRFRGDANFSTWLLGIARNLWRNARRGERTHAPLDDAALPRTDDFDAPSAADLHQDLESALQHLSPDEQLAIYLGYQQGLSHAEMAELLDWPLGTVKTHLARGKEKLRHLLAVWNPQT